MNQLSNKQKKKKQFRLKAALVFKPSDNYRGRATPLDEFTSMLLKHPIENGLPFSFVFRPAASSLKGLQKPPVNCSSPRCSIMYRDQSE